MATAPVDRERALRRRRRHERQAVVFGTLVAGLAVAALGAAAVYTGAMSAPFLEREFTSPPPEPTVEIAPAPCLPEGTLPVSYGSIQVQVLNAGGTAGLAGATARELTARGFDVSDTGNYPEALSGTSQISFGQAGLEAAYTLAAHLETPILVLDLREGPGIDLVLGSGFTAPVDPAFVELEPEVPMESLPGCIRLEDALATAQPAPVAQEGDDAEGEPADGAPEDGSTESEGDDAEDGEG